MAKMEVSNPSFVRGFMPTWTNPICMYLLPLFLWFCKDASERREMVSKGFLLAGCHVLQFLYQDQ